MKSLVAENMGTKACIRLVEVTIIRIVHTKGKVARVISSPNGSRRAYEGKVSIQGGGGERDLLLEGVDPR